MDYRGLCCCAPADSAERSSYGFSYNRPGPKLEAFESWKTGTRALITGNIVFSDDTSQPLDLIITTLEVNVPQDMYCNQVVLGNAFFGDDQIKDRRNDQVAVNIGSTLDNSYNTTWLYLEHMYHARRNYKIEFVRDALSVCKGTFANIARMIRFPIAPLLRPISQLEAAQDWTESANERISGGLYGS